MPKLVIVEFMSLDGVVQAPGDPTEDPDGFAHGGWSRPFFRDHRRYLSTLYQAVGGFLFGRKTYEIFAGYWPTVTAPDDEVARALNTRQKYVVSTTLDDAAWQPVSVLRGDVGVAVAELKRQPGRDILVVGSSQLAQALVRHDLVDEYQLWFHPIVLGAGKRLFPQQNRTTSLRLVDTSTTTSGLVIVTYASSHDNGAAAA